MRRIPVKGRQSHRAGASQQPPSSVSGSSPQSPQSAAASSTLVSTAKAGKAAAELQNAWSSAVSSATALRSPAIAAETAHSGRASDAATVLKAVHTLSRAVAHELGWLQGSEGGTPADGDAASGEAALRAAAVHLDALQDASASKAVQQSEGGDSPLEDADGSAVQSPEVPLADRVQNLARSLAGAQEALAALHATPPATAAALDAAVAAAQVYTDTAVHTVQATAQRTQDDAQQAAVKRHEAFVQQVQGEVLQLQGAVQHVHNDAVSRVSHATHVADAASEAALTAQRSADAASATVASLQCTVEARMQAFEEAVRVAVVQHTASRVAGDALQAALRAVGSSSEAPTAVAHFRTEEALVCPAPHTLQGDAAPVHTAVHAALDAPHPPMQAPAAHVHLLRDAAGDSPQLSAAALQGVQDDLEESNGLFTAWLHRVQRTATEAQGDADRALSQVHSLSNAHRATHDAAMWLHARVYELEATAVVARAAWLHAASANSSTLQGQWAAVHRSVATSNHALKVATAALHAQRAGVHLALRAAAARARRVAEVASVRVLRTVRTQLQHMNGVSSAHRAASRGHAREAAAAADAALRAAEAAAAASAAHARRLQACTTSAVRAQLLQEAAPSGALHPDTLAQALVGSHSAVQALRGAVGTPVDAAWVNGIPPQRLGGRIMRMPPDWLRVREWAHRGTPAGQHGDAAVQPHNDVLRVEREGTENNAHAVPPDNPDDATEPHVLQLQSPHAGLPGSGRSLPESLQGLVPPPFASHPPQHAVLLASPHAAASGSSVLVAASPRAAVAGHASAAVAAPLCSVKSYRDAAWAHSADAAVYSGPAAALACRGAAVTTASLHGAALAVGCTDSTVHVARGVALGCARVTLHAVHRASALVTLAGEDLVWKVPSVGPGCTTRGTVVQSGSGVVAAAHAASGTNFPRCVQVVVSADRAHPVQDQAECPKEEQAVHIALPQAAWAQDSSRIDAASAWEGEVRATVSAHDPDTGATAVWCVRGAGWVPLHLVPGSGGTVLPLSLCVPWNAAAAQSPAQASPPTSLLLHGVRSGAGVAVRAQGGQGFMVQTAALHGVLWLQ